jgi:hypothetical protein
MREWDYFKITEIVTRQANLAQLSYLKGKNIFSLNLKEESGYLLNAYPDCSRVRLVRILPNRIFVDFIRRKPIALVKLYRYFAVDDEGVFFLTEDKPEELELPVISGLETKIFGPKPGKRFNTKELLVALSIIKEVGGNNLLKDYKIKRLDLSNLSDASIFISLPPRQQDYSKGRLAKKAGGVLEVKISQSNIKDKINIFAGLISQLNKDLSNIAYIDLRFREPVIKYRDAK